MIRDGETFISNGDSAPQLNFRRRKRVSNVTIDAELEAVLQKWFDGHLQNPNISVDEKVALMKETGLSSRQVKLLDYLKLSPF